MEVKFCGACGSKIQEGSRFCSNCGWSVDSIASKAASVQPRVMPVQTQPPVQKIVAEPFSAPRRSHKGSGFIVFIFILSLILLGGAAFMMTDSGEAIKENILEKWDTLFNKDKSDTKDGKALSSGSQDKSSPSSDPTSQDPIPSTSEGSNQTQDPMSQLLSLENIQTDVTFDDLQGDYMGTGKLIELKNLEAIPEMTEEYIQKFNEILNKPFECDLEVWRQDLEIDMNIEEGMYMDFEDCTLENGVIALDYSEEGEEGLILNLKNDAVVLKENGVYRIKGQFTISMGDGSITYVYDVIKIDESSNLEENDMGSTDSAPLYEDIQTDVTFDDLQGNYKGTGKLVSFENLENVPGITAEYIEKFEGVLNQDFEALLEVWYEDLELEILIEEGMAMDFEDSTLEDGILSYEFSEDVEGMAAALSNTAVVLKEGDAYVIIGQFVIYMGEGSLTYEYNVKKIAE